MITYDQACEQVGFSRNAECPYTVVRKWYAYKHGQSKVFDSKEAALEYSSIIEKFSEFSEEWDQWWKDRIAHENRAVAVWYEALKNEYIDDTFPKKMFDICYSNAYERGHHRGVDLVAEYMGTAVDLAKRILDCQNNYGL